MEASTKETYTYQIGKHILPWFGPMRMNEIMPALRHAHASWLLAGGADLQMVKERLGHGSISTTERYLHTLPDAGDEAVEAFSRIRSRAAQKPA